MTQRLFSVVILIGALSLASSLEAQNRFFFEGDTSVLTETTGHSIEVRCDSDIEVLGFSFAINYNPTAIDVTDVTATGTSAADADYFGGQMDDGSGLIGYGCVFDLDGDFSTQKLPAGSDHVLAIISFDAVATTDTDTVLSLEDVAIAPNTETPVRNVLTNNQGQSVLPNLENSTIEIRVAAPEITQIENGAGRSGDVFQVIGMNFDFGGLAVEVCGLAAEATLRADGVTIDVTAPECPDRDPLALSCVDVVVSTERGNDTETNGFCYTSDPIPTLASVDPTEGRAGDVVTITGTNFGEADFSVTVCGNPATVGNVSGEGTSADVTLPGCPEGSQEIVATNVFGSSNAITVTFLPTTQPDTFVRGDANSDGSIDLTDGVAILAFLFQGASPPKCGDAADTDDNGNLDLSDAIKIFNWLFTGGAPPSEPSPTSGNYLSEQCGSDPNDDDPFGCVDRAAKCVN